jgi:glycerophosphoryl diester phosphodiesterase
LNSVLNIAHRGASGRYPENTLAAFEAAIKIGVAMCELDVHLTRDGIAVVIHDATLDRTTDAKGAVAAMTFAELQRADAGIRFGRQFAGQRVPTLEEVFRLTAGRGGLNIELKGVGTEATVCELIDAHGAVATALVSSFDWAMLARVREIDSRIRVGLLGKDHPQHLLDTASAMQAYAINPNVAIVNASLCAAAHARGLKLYAWTCDDPGRMRRLIADGGDGIMTNYPDRLRAVLAD